MKFREITLIAAILSFTGILPKLIRVNQPDIQLLFIYFAFLWVCVVFFWRINLLTEKHFTHLSAFIRNLLAFGTGFFGLLITHLLIFYTENQWIAFFLNIDLSKTGYLFKLVYITFVRAVLLQAISFVCSYLFSVRKDKEIIEEALEKLQQTQKTIQKTFKSTFIIRFQDKVLPVETTEIAFFYSGDNIVWIYLLSQNKYSQPFTLERLEKELDPNAFFRANRQFLINRNAIERVEQIDNRKLNVKLVQAPPEEIIISKAKSSAFVRWMERQ